MCCVPSFRLAIALFFAAGILPSAAQRQTEDLGRGVVAMRTGSGSAYVSWRMLGSDDDDIAFNLYRSANGAAAVKLNGSPLTTTTDYQDSPGSSLLDGSSLSYSVRPVVDGVEQAASAAYVLPAGSASVRYFDLPFTSDPGPDGPYDTKFAWVGDFNGDGEYDILCDRLSTLGANEQFLEAYLQNGTYLWRMNMGPTSADQSDIYRPGAAAISTGDGDNVTCFDLDGDNHAEAIVRTANGVTVTNAAGTTVTSITSSTATDQFLTVIDGMTGVEIDSAPVPNNWVQHGTLQSKCFIAYLDGKKPSVVLYGYNRASSGAFYRQWTAWDFVNGQLVQRWTWAQNPSTQPGSEGHQIRIADVDNDGRDEIVDIGHVMDDDGTQLYVTELTHGDRFHVTDINPLWPGLETYAIQQNNPSFLATAYMDSGNGGFYQKLFATGVVDVGRGLTADIAPAHLGLEMFSTQPNTYNARGEIILENHPFPYEGLWWDGDRGREFVAGANSTGSSTIVDKFNPATGNNSRLYSVYNDGVHNAYGGRPAFWGDILGDWREEMVLTRNDYTGLRIFTTTTPAQDRRRTLMHNAQYRCQTTTKGYVQASYVDYYLGFETSEDPPQPIDDTDHTWVGASPVFNNAVCPPGESILFDLTGNNASPVALSGTLTPSRVKVFSPVDYTFDGSSGSFSGPMDLLKSGSGTLAITGTHGFTGPTAVWDGALVVDGTLSGSPVTVHGGTWGGPLAKGQTGGRLGGSGTISQPVTLAWRGTLAPGSGNGNAATLHLDGGLTCGDDTTLSLDLSNSGPSDLVAITGNLAIGSSTTIVIHPLGGSLAPGTHTLVTFTGTFSGSLGDIDVVLPPGVPHSLAQSAGAITLTIPVTRSPGAITWKGGSNGNAWDLVQTPNFLLGGSADVFVSGDAVTFNDSGAPNTSVTLEGSLLAGGVTVASSQNYSFGGTGTINGGGGLVKSGSGTLSLPGSHGFTGPVSIQSGTIAVNSLGDGGNPSSLGAGSTAASNLVFNGGAIRLDGPQTSTNRNMRLEAAGGNLIVPSATLQISGSLEGPGALTKSGAGLLILANANSHAGGNLIDEGTLQLASDTANVSGLGSGPVTFLGGTLSMYDNRDTSSWHTVNYQLSVPAGETGRLNTDGRCNIDGSLTGGGDFTYYTPFVRTSLRANWSAFSGNVFVIADGDGGDFRLENSNGFANARVDFGENVYAYYNSSMGSNLTLAIGTLSGASTSWLRSGPTSGRTLTWQVGARNEDSTFAGTIADSSGPCALAKVGAGTLVLSGASTHTGATNISGGRLRLTGSSSFSNFTTQNGGTLGGTGTITGTVSVQSGGGLEHNSLGGGNLVVQGNLALDGNIVVRPAAGITIQEGTYTVVSYTGSLSGSPVFSWEAPSGSLLTATFSTASAGVVTMTLSAPPRVPGPITWVGNVSSNWNTATANWTNAGGPTIYQNGDTPTFTDAGNAASPVSLVSSFLPAGVVVDSAQNYTFGGGGEISGEASLTKSGSGTLTISSAHTFSGGTTIQGGTLAISTAAALGSGQVSLGGGTWATGGLSPQNPILVTADSAISGGHPGGSHGVKNITGSGILTLAATNVFDLEGDISGFSGTIFLTGSGSFRFFNASNNGSSAATFDLGTRSLQARSGAAFNLGALAGQSGSSLQGAGGGGNNTWVTYTIGGNNADSLFAGSIVNGNAPASIIKTGTGTLTLSGDSTHTGTTTVSSGGLSVTGSLAATATTVAEGGTLGGGGTIGGAVTCHGRLAPGAPVGTLTLSSGLTLSSSSVLDFDLGLGSDRATVTGNLVLDGVVNVSAGAGFVPGTYTILTYTGTLTNQTLQIGSMPSGFSASVDTSVNGQVRLVVAALNAPPEITVSPAASPSPANLASPAGLTVTATDDGGEALLSYGWSSSGPAAVAFSPNNSNSAKNATATFSQTGQYTLTVTVTDLGGLTDQESVVVLVEKATATVVLGNLAAGYDGAPKPVSVTTTPSGLACTIDYAGSGTAPVVPGSYAVSATIDDPVYQGSASGTLVISPRSFEVWETDTFSPAEISAGDSALDADPDRDGLRNLAEYALGTDPRAFTPAPQALRQPDAISLTFQRPAWIGDVAYQALRGDAPSTAIPVPLEVLDPGADPETVRARFVFPGAAPPAHFLRLEFTK